MQYLCKRASELVKYKNELETEKKIIHSKEIKVDDLKKMSDVLNDDISGHRGLIKTLENEIEKLKFDEKERINKLWGILYDEDNTNLYTKEVVDFNVLCENIADLVVEKNELKHIVMEKQKIIQTQKENVQQLLHSCCTDEETDKLKKYETLNSFQDIVTQISLLIVVKNMKIKEYAMMLNEVEDYNQQTSEIGIIEGQISLLKERINEFTLQNKKLYDILFNSKLSQDNHVKFSDLYERIVELVEYKKHSEQLAMKSVADQSENKNVSKTLFKQQETDKNYTRLYYQENDICKFITH